VKGKWTVLNSTAPEAVTDYDPANPLLGFTVYHSDRYYVMFKGKDPLDYGAQGNDDVTAAMRKASRTMALGEKAAGILRTSFGEMRLTSLGNLSEGDIRSFDTIIAYAESVRALPAILQNALVPGSETAINGQILKYRTTSGVVVVISGKNAESWKAETSKLNVAMLER